MPSAHRHFRSSLFATSILAWMLFSGGVTLAESDADVDALRKIGKAFTSVAKKASPAVVKIKVEKSVERSEITNSLPRDPFERFFGSPRRSPRRHFQGGQGSGFIVSSDGYVLTNNHVVHGARKITVQLADGRDLPARIVGTDQRSDLAVIKVDATDLPVLPLGDSDRLEVGEWVIAIGSPFGLGHTVTAGIVSAKGRSAMGINDYEEFIQTDAAINRGNSGGPLINLDGEAVGINTAIFSLSGGYMGIGFAIPVNMAKSIYKQLVQTGTVVRGFLGVRIQDLTPDLAQISGLKSTAGVLISEVMPDSPAERAGFQAGDVIVEMDRQAAAKIGPFRIRVARLSPGTRTEFIVMRDGRRKSLAVKIGRLAAVDEPRAEAPKPETLSRLGISVQNLDKRMAERLGIDAKAGIVVTRVKPDSMAAEKGIAHGTLILEVNHWRVESADEFADLIHKARPKGKVLLLIQESDGARYVVLYFE